MKTIKTIAQETWHVRPNYGQENEYRVWDADDNYHEDTSPETMDKRAALIAAAPKLLTSLRDMLSIFEDYAEDWDSDSVGMAVLIDARLALLAAKEKQS